ncbi:MAG: RibD family protein [Pseudomonadota bacterium]
MLIEMTDKIWSHLLHMRNGTVCSCDKNWSNGEKAALDLYEPLARRDHGPFALAQIGQSLDGRIATVTGDARDVSGPDGLVHLHRIRALVDGVVIGVRTALHDKPRLTVRLCTGKNPARVVIDPNGRLPDDALLLQNDGTRRIVIQATGRPRPKDVTVIRLPLKNGVIDPREITVALRQEGLSTLLVEGGGITIAKFLEMGLLNRLHVGIAPLLIGDGPQSITLSNPSKMLADAIRPDMRAYSLGSDVMLDCAMQCSAT